jgi:hypothetical protein
MPHVQHWFQNLIDLLKTAHHCTCTVHGWLKTEDVKASISGI